MGKFLLVSDANILIDIEDAALAPLIFCLPFDIAVSDFLFEQELRERHEHLLGRGLKVKSLNPESIRKIEILRDKYPHPSIADHSALVLAIQEQCVLLTGDRDLRSAAEKEGIEVHGTLWIIEELLSAKLIKVAEARNGFDAMKAKGSRLPWGEVEKLLEKWMLVEPENLLS